MNTLSSKYLPAFTSTWCLNVKNSQLLILMESQNSQLHLRQDPVQDQLSRSPDLCYSPLDSAQSFCLQIFQPFSCRGRPLCHGPLVVQVGRYEGAFKDLMNLQFTFSAELNRRRGATFFPKAKVSRGTQGDAKGRDKTSVCDRLSICNLRGKTQVKNKLINTDN